MLRSFTTLTLATALFSVAQSNAQTWQLVWNDEFDGPVGTSPSPQKWFMATGGGGWGNGELETYTNSTSNVFLDGNGNLVIQALRTASGGYTSGRLSTEFTMAASYGKIEARMKLPVGKGIWPSFWMLGT